MTPESRGAGARRPRTAQSPRRPRPHKIKYSGRIMVPLLDSEMGFPPPRSELDKSALSRSMKNRPTSCLVTRTRRILTRAELRAAGCGHRDGNQ